MNIKFIKYVLPPFLIDILNKILLREISIKGKFRTWKDAEKKTTGYENGNIINKVITSFEKVQKNLDLYYERDGYIFKKPDFDYELLFYINYLFSKNQKINIIDYGGGLGSKFFQNIEVFKKFKNMKWHIVEQINYRNYARKKINVKNLFFYENLDEVFKKKIIPDMAIFSSSINYLPKPYQILQKLINRKSLKSFIFLKTAFHDDIDTIKIQKVPKNIYDASYPIRIFNKKKFEKFFLKKNFFLKFENNLHIKISGIVHNNLFFVKKQYG